MGDEKQVKKLWNKMQAVKGLIGEGMDDASVSAEINSIYEEMEQIYNRFMENYLDFREISDNLYDGIHITDGTGRIIYINEAYTRTTGIKPEQILGRFVKDIEAEGKLYKGSVTEKVIETRERINAVAQIFVSNKEVLVTGTPMFDENGNIKLVVTNNRDISQLKEMQEEIAKLQQVSAAAQEELAFLRRQQIANEKICYQSKAMEDVIKLAHNVAGADVTVLITGESGTGKELLADEIYYHSNRNGKPFIKVNCAAIPGELLESELFGYEGGAFTDAKKEGKAGMFELANGGVILLDEIGDMPFNLQTKLLRVLQQHEIMRIGGKAAVKLDIRIIASTNRDLSEDIKTGKFREDLYYRLNVVPIQIKPLRERKEDVLCLAEVFRTRYNKKYGKNVKTEPGANSILLEYEWPGNIRELENLVERLTVINESGIITAEDVLVALNKKADSPFSPYNSESPKLKEYLKKIEMDIIFKTIENQGSKRRAAKILGMDHSTLVKKCQEYEKIKDNTGE